MKPTLRLSSRSSSYSLASLPALQLLSSLIATLFASPPAQAQLLPNRSAPADQRPVLLRTASGLPQIDITRPTAAGVSINQFRQFDIDAQGAVINNGREASYSALAGWVVPNPALIAGEAGVIVNEIRSTDPSRLRGYVEIAGGKAELVIANPAGISCDGCGFIHASRVELATAVPEFQRGQLTGYLPGKGVLEIAGHGLDARRVDALSILTQAARINAGIWANDLRLTLNTPATPSSVTADAAAPVYALDVASLGGMYANRIWLVGTAQGLGVRNAGNWSATESLTVSIDGKLENSNGIDARELTVKATAIDNVAHGKLLGERIALQADRIANAGHPEASPVIAATTDIDIGTRTLENTDQATLFAGADIHIGRQLDAEAHATGKAESVLNRFATIEALGKLSIQATRLQNLNAGVDIEEVQVGQTVPLSYLQPNSTGTKYTMDHFYWEAWSRAGQYKWVTDKTKLQTGMPGKTPLPDVDGTDCITDAGIEQCTPTPGSAYPRDDPAWAYFGLTPPDLPPPAPGPEPQRPALNPPPPLASSANAEDQLAWARANTGYEIAMAEYQTSKHLRDLAAGAYDQWQAVTSQRREALNDAISGYNAGFSGVNIRSWTQYKVDRSEYESRVVSSAPGRIIAGSDMTLTGDDFLNDRSQVIAGGKLAGDLQNLRSIDAEGTHRVQETGTSQFSRSSYHGWLRNYHTRLYAKPLPYAPADVLTTVRLPVTVTSGDQAAALPSPATNVAMQRIATDGSSLFRMNLASGPLFITDPRFTAYRQWLNSDAMLAQLSADPARLQKRLGDGYVEQRIVREQIAQLTGRRFLPGQDNDEAQYAALMASGVYQASALQLTPGIALTAAQLAKLTSDIVWLVEQDLALPARDGQPASTVRVLVPRVYLLPRAGDLAGDLAGETAGEPDGAGTLISARRVALSVADALDNAGTIAGSEGVQLQAHTLRLTGTVSGDNALLAAREDIDLQGGAVHTRNDQWLLAGRDIRVASTVRDSHRQSSTKGATSDASRTMADRMATLHVTGNGNLTLLAGHDIALDAAHLRSNGRGNIAVLAGHDLVLGTVTISASTAAAARTSANFLREAQQEDLGTKIQATGSVTLSAAQDIAARAAQIESSSGTVTISAGRDAAITAGDSSASFAQGTEFRSSGLFGSSTSTRRTTSDHRDAQASTLSGGAVQLSAGRDLQISGSDVIGDQSTRLHAGRDVAIAAVTETVSNTSYSRDTQSGLLSGPRLSVGIGTRRQQEDSELRRTRQRGSLVGSAAGDVRVDAEDSFRQEASQLMAPSGTVGVAATTIDIRGGTETFESRQSASSSQSGLSISLSNPVIDTARSLSALQQASQSTHQGRAQALAAAAAGLAVANAAKDIAKDPAHAGGVTLAATLGSSKSESTSTVQASSVAPAVVAAGGEVSLQARGRPDSSLAIAGSRVNAGDRVSLMSDGALTLDGQANTSRQSSANKSSSTGLGLAASFGKDGTGIGLIASAGKAHGDADGQNLEWTNTVIAAGGHASLQSAGDTRLSGAVVNAPTVNARVGGDLILESPQDSSRYQSHQQSLHASVTIPLSGKAGPVGQLNASKSTIHSDYLSTGEASGIQAGDGGFQVEVRGKARLKGAAIASTEAAVDAGRNTLHAAALELRDLQNHADYEAHAAGVGIGVGRNPQGGYAPKGNSAGMGSDSGHQTSVTTAGISGIAGNQQIRTGDPTTSLNKIFDAERVAKEINAQVAITQEFSGQAYKAVSNYLTEQRSNLKEKYGNARDEAERKILKEELGKLRREEQVMNILIGAVIGTGGTAIAKEGLSSAAEKMRELMIEDSKIFAGITDKTTTISNMTGESDGVRTDQIKIGGTRVDLDFLCGKINEKCVVMRDERGQPILDEHGKTQLILDDKGMVQFDTKSAGMSLDQYLKSKEGKKMFGPTGGIQGIKGTLFGIPYKAGSWQDNLIESFAGAHDYIGGKLTGLYDNKGNIKRGMSESERNSYDSGAVLAIVPAAPFAAAEFLPPAIWSAISVVLQSAK